MTDKDIHSFSEEQENENTKRKTFYDIKVFLEFLHSENEARNSNIHEIPPKELNNLAKKFALSVRKTKRRRVRTMFYPSIFTKYRPLPSQKWLPTISLLNDREFSEVQDFLKKKQKQLKPIGKGNKPNSADPLTDEEIEQLYCDGVLGNKTPRGLLNTVWLNNCIFFGMRPGKEQRDLCWGDLELKVDAQGVRYVEFSTERQTKTRRKPDKYQRNKAKDV